MSGDRVSGGQGASVAGWRVGDEYVGGVGTTGAAER
jgi:hypothetical protein